MTAYTSVWHCSHCDYTEKIHLGEGNFSEWSGRSDWRSAVYERDGKNYYGEQKRCVKCEEWTDVRGIRHFNSERYFGGAEASTPIFLWEIEEDEIHSFRYNGKEVK